MTFLPIRWIASKTTFISISLTRWSLTSNSTTTTVQQDQHQQAEAAPLMTCTSGWRGNGSDQWPSRLPHSTTTLELKGLSGGSSSTGKDETRRIIINDVCQLAFKTSLSSRAAGIWAHRCHLPEHLPQRFSPFEYSGADQRKAGVRGERCLRETLWEMDQGSSGQVSRAKGIIT